MKHIEIPLRQMFFIILLVDAGIYIKATRKNEAQLTHVHNDEPQIPVLMNRAKDNIKVAVDSNIFQGTVES